MKRAKALVRLAVLGLVLFVAAVAWPATSIDIFPDGANAPPSCALVCPRRSPTSCPPIRRPAPRPPRQRRRRAPAAAKLAVVARPPVPVVVDTVQRGPMAVRIDAVGTVQPISSVAIKTRIDAAIDDIKVADGAAVKAGEVIVELDARQIDAQIKQSEAALAKDQTVLEQATRDAARFQVLVAKGADTQLNLDNAKTAVAAAKAQIANDEALIENRESPAELVYDRLADQRAGRHIRGQAGNILRASDNTTTGTLATIVQTQPIYVAFSVPQTLLPELHDAIAANGAETTATPQGGSKPAIGKVSVLDNTVDPTTGTIMVRATFPNDDELLWPGQLCNVRVTLRTDPDTISIPREATQSGQIGTFVYVIENGIAHIRQVKLGRFQDGRDIVLDGLQGGETVVTDGALQLVEGARVEIQKDNSQKGAI